LTKGKAWRSLQVFGVKRFKHQNAVLLQRILKHYTQGKAISDYGLNGQTTAMGWNCPQSVLRWRGESSLSHRHRLVMQSDYQPRSSLHLPVLGDWHISALAT